MNVNRQAIYRPRQMFARSSHPPAQDLPGRRAGPSRSSLPSRGAKGGSTYFSRNAPFAALCLATLTLAGCTSVPLRSLWALRQLDFATFDPAQVYAMALLPAGVGAPPEALKLTLKAQRGGGSAEVVEEHLALRAAAALQAPPEAAPAGAHWLPLAFDDADLARFTALRSRLQGWKAADGKVADRSFNLAVEPALCSTAPGGVETKKVVVSAWLRWKADQALLQILDGAALKDIAQTGDKLPPRLPACG